MEATEVTLAAVSLMPSPSPSPSQSPSPSPPPYHRYQRHRRVYRYFIPSDHRPPAGKACWFPDQYGSIIYGHELRNQCHTHTQRPLPPLPRSPAPAPPAAEQLPPARVCSVRTVTRPRRCHLPYRQRLSPPPHPSSPPPPLTTEPRRTMIETFRLETDVI